MKISFIRHGQTNYNKQGLITGHTDIPLNEEGLEQARKTSFDGLVFDHIYSSDLLRCKQTTEVINENLNLPVTYDARLKERNLGSLEGTAWEDMDEAMRENDKNQIFDYRPFGGESDQDTKERVFGFIEEMKSKYPNGHILVVTSGGIIRFLHNKLNKETHLFVHNAEVHEFEF